MAGLFSPTAYKRLPAFAREMEKTDQDIFIFLRLRKGIQRMAAELGLSLEETERRARSVAHCLARNNSLHLIRDPECVPLPGEGREMQGSSLSLEEHAALSQFLRYFAEALKEILPEERNLLKLYFCDQWTGGKILAFYGKARFPLPLKGGNKKGITQKDISDALHEAVKNLLQCLRRLLGKEAAGASPSVKDLIVILEEAGHREELW